jgi:hypothetical protein
MCFVVTWMKSMLGDFSLTWFFSFSFVVTDAVCVRWEFVQVRMKRRLLIITAGIRRYRASGLSQRRAFMLAQEQFGYRNTQNKEASL